MPAASIASRPEEIFAMSLSPEKPTLGFVGLGIMGVPMVLRLLDQGYDVTVWNREPERADLVVPHGAVWADSPAAVRKHSDIVMFCVLDGDAVEECCFGKQGIAQATSGADMLVDFSTISPGRTRALAARLKQDTGMDWLDAPLSGGPGPAREGRLTVMAGGEPALLGRAKPVLESLAANLTQMGSLGAGQTTKILNQALVGVNYVLMAELLSLAESTEIDVAALPAALAGGMADSVILQRIFPQMQRGDYDPPKAYARQLNKDLEALGQFCRERDLELPLIERAVQRYAAYVAAGNTMADSAAIGRFYQRQAKRNAVRSQTPHEPK
jgi:3-hydroxyisobutyrate dehydrogenase